jgi:hypothetical protein
MGRVEALVVLGFSDGFVIAERSVSDVVAVTFDIVPRGRLADPRRVLVAVVLHGCLTP